jgi:hypothetical protein
MAVVIDPEKGSLLRAASGRMHVLHVCAPKPDVD